MNPELQKSLQVTSLSGSLDSYMLIVLLIMIAAGLLLSMVGQDVITGQPRFTLGIPELTDGFGVVVQKQGFKAAQLFSGLRFRMCGGRGRPGNVRGRRELGHNR